MAAGVIKKRHFKMNWVLQNLWKVVAIIVVGLICLLVCAFGLAFFSDLSFDWKYNRAAVWANNQTATVLADDHKWDSVRIMAISKDGIYILVAGSVTSEADLADLHAKLAASSSKTSPAPVHVAWGVAVETNRNRVH